MSALFGDILWGRAWLLLPAGHVMLTSSSQGKHHFTAKAAASPSSALGWGSKSLLVSTHRAAKGQSPTRHGQLLSQRARQPRVPPCAECGAHFPQAFTRAGSRIPGAVLPSPCQPAQPLLAPAPASPNKKRQEEIKELTPGFL